jgi:riboflavin kinase/FMN adenylyltransferase
MLRRLTDQSKQFGLPATVLTFEPHPREFFAPDTAPARLSSLREKLVLLAEGGVERAHICRFDGALAALGAQEFIERFLVRGLSARYLIIGDDFRFGRGRGGDFELLRAGGARYRFGVEALPTVTVGDQRVSSSGVRECLESGDLEGAARLLGGPYCIAGRVVHGEKLGRRLGFPTANVQLKRRRVALTGIFAVLVEGAGRGQRPGVASLGVRPTINSLGIPALEVHLFDWDSDLYRAHLTVSFLHKLRDEEKYHSIDALRAQIARDVEAARDYFCHRRATA